MTLLPLMPLRARLVGVMRPAGSEVHLGEAEHPGLVGKHASRRQAQGVFIRKIAEYANTIPHRADRWSGVDASDPQDGGFSCVRSPGSDARLTGLSSWADAW